MTRFIKESRLAASAAAVDYSAPLDALGQFFGGRLITRQLEQMFIYRYKTTKRLVESGESAPQR